MDDLLENALAWTKAGGGIATATVVGTWGSSPRPVGSQLVVNAEGEFEGSVSGGCIEGAVITEALDVIADGLPRQLEYSVDNERAWEVGLTCGGTVRVLVAKGPGRDLLNELRAMRAARRSGVIVTDTGTGTQALVCGKDGAPSLDAGIVDAALEALGQAKSGFAEIREARYFLHVFRAAPRMVVIGAVHVSQALAPMAELAGFDVTVVDPRRAFATDDRFPASRLVTDWPDDYFASNAPDAATAVVTLAHDPKLDDPALIAGLRSEAFYVGALGSRKTHGSRVTRLEEEGLERALIDRIHAPVGLDLGGRQPGEVAVSILSEAVQAWNRGGDR